MGEHSYRLDTDKADEPAERRRLKRIFAQVMIVQVVALVLLWLLQSLYGNG